MHDVPLLLLPVALPGKKDAKKDQRGKAESDQVYDYNIKVIRTCYTKKGA
jgi:hypothetical protein